MDIVQVVGPVEPVVDEQRIAWELEGFVTGHYAAVDGMAVRTDRDDDNVRPRWSIDSLGAADWCMQQVARVQSLVDEYHAEVVRWTEVRDRVARAGEFFRGHLERWAIGERTDKRKSFPLAHGTVSTREQPRSVEIVAVDAAVAWCKGHHPAAVKTTEEVRLRDLVHVLRIADVVRSWQFTDQLGEVWTIGSAELEGVLDHHDTYRPLADLVRAVLAEHASPLHLAADSVEAEYIRTRLAHECSAVGVERAALLGIANVRAVLTPGVVDGDGLEVPGFGVRQSKVTATVSAST